jgi:hypothetical protein
MWHFSVLSPLRFSAPYSEQGFARFATFKSQLMLWTYHACTVFTGMAAIVMVLVDDTTPVEQILFSILTLLLIMVSASNLWFMIIHQSLFVKNCVQITTATRFVTNVLVTEMRNVWNPSCWRTNNYEGYACFWHLAHASLTGAQLYHMHGMPLPLSLHLPLQLVQLTYTLSRTPAVCAKEPWLQAHTSQIAQAVGWDAMSADLICPGVLCLFLLGGNLLGTLLLYVMEICDRRQFLLESRPLLWGPLQWPMGNRRFTRWFLLEWPVLILAATALFWLMYVHFLLPGILLK